MPYRADNSPSRNLAVIDIGSNSVRMVIYDVAHSPPAQRFNEKLFCALGRDLGTTGALNVDGKGAALKALKAYALICSVQQVDKVIVAGTAALREASDGPDFIRTVESETGFTIRVISGDEEAQYAARGLLMHDKDANGVVGDFGGGSLELAAVAANHITDTISLPMGAYRIIAMGHDSDAGIEALVAPLVPRFGAAPCFYGIGGSWRSLAASYALETGHQGKIATADMVAFCEKIEAMDTSSLQAVYRLEVPRAKLAPVSAYTLRRVLTILRPGSFTVSSAGVRDGIVHEFIAGLTTQTSSPSGGKTVE